MLHTQYACEEPYPHRFRASSKRIFGSQILPCRVSTDGLALNCPMTAVLFIDGTRVATLYNKMLQAPIRTEERTRLLRDCILTLNLLCKREGWVLLREYGVAFAAISFSKLLEALFTQMLYDSHRSAPATTSLFAVAYETKDLFEEAHLKECADIMLKEAHARAGSLLRTMDKLPWLGETRMNDLENKALVLKVAHELLQNGTEKQEVEELLKAGYQYESAHINFDLEAALHAYARRHYKNVARKYVNTLKVESI